MAEQRAKRSSVIGRRLGRALFATSGIAALVSCLVLGAHEISSFQASTNRTIRTLAQTISLTLADAVRFDDELTAMSVLASTDAAPEILAVGLYDADGKIFARHQSDSTSGEHLLPPRLSDAMLGLDETRIDDAGTDLVVYHPLAIEGRHWGTFLIVWSTSDFWAQLWTTVALVACLLSLVLVASWFATNQLRREIANPLSMLASEALVAVPDDARAALRDGDDEIEVLRKALAAWVAMRQVIDVIDENTSVVSGGVDALREASGAMQEEAQLQAQAADEAIDSVTQIARSTVDASASVDRVAERFQDTSSSIRELGVSGGLIENRMQGLMESVDSASFGSQQTAAGLQQTANAMSSVLESSASLRELADELARSVEGVGAKAGDTGEVAEGARTTAHTGAHVVDQTRLAIEEIDRTFSTIQETVGDLSERCGEIGDSLRVIESIADETNLLALNAAIIAAQSGEHGRAFSVVAESVRGLAVRTVGSAREIHDSLAILRASATRATETVEGAGEKVSRGVAYSNQAGDALKDIIQASAVAAAHVEEIATVAREQSADLAKVRSAIEGVDTLVEEVSRSVDSQKEIGSEIANAMAGVREVSQQVGSLMTQQKLETEKISAAASDVESELDSIRRAAKSQAEVGLEIGVSLDLFRAAAKTGTARAQSVHEIVASLAEQTTRLRGVVKDRDF